METRFLKIDGGRATGKSVLQMLLDGHEDVFVSPFHDAVFEAFFDHSDRMLQLIPRLKNDDWLKAKDIYTLRTLLSQTAYYKFEIYFRNGFFPLDISHKDRVIFPWHFDFYHLDKSYISAMMAEEYWTIESAIMNYYRALMVTLNPEDANRPKKYFAAMGLSRRKTNIHLKRSLPTAKCIQIKRSVEGIIATLSKRRPLDGDFSTQLGYSRSFNTSINEGTVESLLKRYREFDEMTNRFPDHFISIELEELVGDTEQTMRRVAAFLEIPFNSMLTTPTFLGQPFKGNEKVLGKVNDDPNILLSSREKMIINFHKSLFSFHKSGINPLSYNAVMRILLSRLRRLRTFA